MRKWNWTAFWVILIVAYMGALSNDNYPQLKHALIMGTFFGLSFGILIAWLTKEES
jgi:hypothetical protein